MRFAYILSVLLLSAIAASSAVKTWDGGGADSNLQTSANWVGDVAPLAGDDLVFPASLPTATLTNNFPNGTSFRSLAFQGGSYTINGNSLSLSNGIIADSGVHTLGFSLTITAAQTFSTLTAASSIIATALTTGSNTLTIDGNGQTGIGLIFGSGNIIKNGLGQSLVAASFLYSGDVTINGGIFVFDATSSSTDVTINPNGALGGTGRVGAVSVNPLGALSAGTLQSPTGVFNTGSISISPDGIFAPKLGGTTPGSGGHDQVNVTGTITLANSRLAPIPWNNFRPAIGNSFLVLTNDGADPINGTFAGIPEGAVFSGPLGTAFRVSYLGGTGNDISITRVNRANFDFDGDGKSDVSTFRPSGGIWNISNSGGGTQSQQFGLGTDKITPADFDGDSRADFAVFRPESGTWFILNSLNSTLTAFQFGANGDIPVPNDFDGDGRADATVWRAGVWFKFQSLGNQVVIEQFGSAGDKPLVGDYDGDGFGDLSVYRPSEGTWHILRSSDDVYSAFQFGLPSDRPAPADFDGDGKTDYIIFRATANPALPDFYIVRAGDLGFQGVQWGTTGDIPSIADYDGDGKADIGIFRPATNDWFWLRSSDLAAGVANFGASGDLPVPAAFVP